MGILFLIYKADFIEMSAKTSYNVGNACLTICQVSSVGVSGVGVALKVGMRRVGMAAGTALFAGTYQSGCGSMHAIVCVYEQSGCGIEW